MWTGFWKADTKKVPYVHPWRNDKGSFSTKENDAFASTGTNRGDHKANLDVAKKHGFQVTADHRTLTEMEKNRHKLVLDHANGTFAHTIEYPAPKDAHPGTPPAGTRSFKGMIAAMDEHMQKWA